MVCWRIADATPAHPFLPSTFHFRHDDLDSSLSIGSITTNKGDAKSYRRFENGLERRPGGSNGGNAEKMPTTERPDTLALQPPWPEKGKYVCYKGISIEKVSRTLLEDNYEHGKSRRSAN